MDKTGRRDRAGSWNPVLVAVLLTLAGCATRSEPMASQADEAKTVPVVDLASSHGIRIAGLHLSAHGYILDLRYRVLDPDKAAPLLNSKNKVTLVDEAHHARLGIPESPIIGGMRQTSRNRVIYTDRDYFILFVNPGRVVKVGDTLKLAVDDTKIAELTVR